MSQSSNDWSQKRGSGSRKFYFAYGANCNVRAMQTRLNRCQVEPIGAALLDDHKLVFRSVASIERADGMSMYGALWELSTDGVASLDSYEGGAYRKMNITVLHPILGTVDAFTYYMTVRTDQSPPAEAYRALIEKGYSDFGIPQSQLHDALNESRASFKDDINRICGETFEDDELWGR